VSHLNIAFDLHASIGTVMHDILVIGVLGTSCHDTASKLPDLACFGIYLSLFVRIANYAKYLIARTVAVIEYRTRYTNTILLHMFQNWSNASTKDNLGRTSSSEAFHWNRYRYERIVRVY